MSARPSRKPPRRGNVTGHPRAPVPKRTGKAHRRRWLGAVGLGLLLAGFTLGPLFAWAHARGSGKGQRVVVEWPSGLDALAAGARLKSANLIERPRLMALYLWFTRSTGELRPGHHVLNDALSPAELVARLGRRPSRSPARVTLSEGYNHLQMAARLEEREICVRQDFVAAVHDRALLGAVGVRADTAEGYLFPATYTWPVDSDATDVVRTMVTEFRRRMDQIERAHPGVLEDLASSRGWGEHDVVVLASIVEKETARPDERPLVASVYHNRLVRADFEPRGRLQSDPTAAYGCLIAGGSIASCAGFSGHVTPAMLRDPTNPYNTYRHAGLPPGPIANPGEAALTAALVPAATDYLFFVTNGAGGHTFSRSFAEHQQAIQR